MVTLSISSISTQAGMTVSLDVSIASSGGDQCTDIQFTVTHSTFLSFTQADRGAAAAAAVKLLSKSGDVILITGVNTNVIPNGILATIRFLVDPAAPTAVYPIGAVSIVASDVNANALSTAIVAGVVTVGTPGGPLTIACPAATTAVIGVPYVGGFVVTGGTPPYNVTVPSGMLPPGLTVNPLTGLFSGSPTSPGVFPFSGQVQDSLGTIATT